MKDVKLGKVTGRLVSLLLGIVVTIFILELFFYVVPFFSSSLYETRSHNEIDHYLEDAKDGIETVRIITLGESTTDKYFVNGQDVSWPRQLEHLLNQSLEINEAKKVVRHLNLGRSGTSTTFLADDLEELLSKPEFRAKPPHFVISMMGVNDAVSLIPQKSWLFRKSFVARFLYWAWIDFSCPDCYRISSKREHNHVVSENSKAPALFYAIPNVKWPRSRSEFESLQKSFTNLTKFNPEVKNELLLLWGIWLFSYSEWLITMESAGFPQIHESITQDPAEMRRETLIAAKAAFETAREEVIKRQGSMKQACYVYYRLDDSKACRDLILDGVSSGVDLTSDLLITALHAQAGEDPRYQRLIKTAGYQFLKNDQAILATRNSYLRVAELSRQHGFHWLIMQYPTGEVGGLKEYFNPLNDAEFLSTYPNFVSLFFIKEEASLSDKKEPQATGAAILSANHYSLNFRHSFVSNANFRELAKGEKQPEYFLDLFAKAAGMPFGHTTELGHKQIAINVANVITPLIIQP